MSAPAVAPAPDWAEVVAQNIARQILHIGMRESVKVIAGSLREARAAGMVDGIKSAERVAQS